MRLNQYDTTTDGDVALLQIYADGAKTSASPLGATLQSVQFANPPGSNVVGDFTFTPTSTFTFAADTRYWLLVDATVGFYAWRGNNPAITPIGTSGITFNDYQLSIDNGASYSSNAVFNTFEINATAVPFEFETTGGLVMLGGAWLLHKHLQKKKT